MKIIKSESQKIFSENQSQANEKCQTNNKFTFC